jgi:heme exporter protein D
MINEIISMNGYGAYVWSAFSFTLISFAVLYAVIKMQLVKEQIKFNAKFVSLTSDKIQSVKAQATYREILANTSTSKI